MNGMGIWERVYRSTTFELSHKEGTDILQDERNGMCKGREVRIGKLKWFNDAREGGDGRWGYCAGCAKMFGLSPVGNGNFWCMLSWKEHDQSHRVIHLSSQSLLQCKPPLLSQYCFYWLASLCPFTPRLFPFSIPIPEIIMGGFNIRVHVSPNILGLPALVTLIFPLFSLAIHSQNHIIDFLHLEKLKAQVFPPSSIEIVRNCYHHRCSN